MDTHRFAFMIELCISGRFSSCILDKPSIAIWLSIDRLTLQRRMAPAMDPSRSIIKRNVPILYGSLFREAAELCIIDPSN